MRTTTGTQDTDLARSVRQERFRLRIADHNGTLQDYTQYVTEYPYAMDQDRFTARMQVTLHREVEGASLVPTMNANPPIKEAREVVLETAVIAPDADYTTGDLEEVFRGEIVAVDTGSDLDGVMNVECAGLGQELNDTWIEEEAEYGNSSSPVAQETVMQSILDATLSTEAPTLQVPSTPGFGIVRYTQQRMSLANALKQHADLIGWNIRYLWDEGAGEFRLTYLEPDREKTTPDATYTPDDYFRVGQLAWDTNSIRNRVIIQWSGDDAENEGIANDPDSQNEFGIRVMFIDAASDPFIDSETKAQALADAMVSDLGQPLATLQAELSYSWHLELGDLLRFSANDVLWDSDLDIAVTTIDHQMSGDPRVQNRTIVQGRARPSGGTVRWINFAKRAKSGTGTGVGPTNTGVPAPPPTGTLEAILTGTDLSATLEVNAQRALSARILGDTSPPSQAAVEVASPINVDALGRLDTGDIGVLDTLSPGDTGHVAAIVYSGANGIGTQSTVIRASTVFPEDAGPGGAVTLDIDDMGVTTAILAGNDQVASWRFFVQVGSPPSDGQITGASPTDGQYLDSGDLGTLLTADPRDKVYLGAIPYSEAGGNGDVGARIDAVQTFGVGTDGVDDAAITPQKATEQAQRFSWTGNIFTTYDDTFDDHEYGTNGGVLRIADGSSFTINAISTTIYSQALYIYWDPDISTVDFQVSTNEADIIGDRKIFIGYLNHPGGNPGPGTAIKAVGTLGVGGEALHTDSVSVSTLQANSVTAVALAAITMEVGKFIRSSSYSGGSSGWNIDANGNVEFNDGTFRGTVDSDTFTGVNATFANALIVQGNLSAGANLFITGNLEHVGTLGVQVGFFNNLALQQGPLTAEDGMLANAVTRIGEIEDALVAYGLLDS